MQKGNSVRRFASFLTTCYEGMEMNWYLLHSRRQTWMADQIVMAQRRKLRPDMKCIIRRYPCRLPLPDHLSTLYKEVMYDLKKALVGWRNPWVLDPPCFFVPGLNVPAVYRADRHEIWLSPVFEYWDRQIQVFLPSLRFIARCDQHNELATVAWKRLSQQMMEEAATYRRHLEAVETQGLFAGLSRAWLAFEAQLPGLIAQCAQQGLLTEAFLSWCESLMALHTMVQGCLRRTFLHELIHAWTRWGDVYQEGKRTYRLIGLTRVTPTTGNLANVSMNEALTEWFTEYFYRHLYGEPQIRWREAVHYNCYPSWIIGYIVEAMDNQWEHIAKALPFLADVHVVTAMDLLYAIYFSHPEAFSWLKIALEVMCNDSAAFEKVSRACEQFLIPLHGNAESVQTSWEELCALLNPLLSENICLPPVLRTLIQQENEEQEQSA
jgi:hypothetical protein